MGRTLSQDEAELYKRCDEVLYYAWDPIGVSDEPYARDEYRSYLPQVFQLVKANASRERIEKYLAEIVKTNMGLEPQPQRDRSAAELLLKWRERICEDAA
jgi:hypothetical protein